MNLVSFDEYWATIETKHELSVERESTRLERLPNCHLSQNFYREEEEKKKNPDDDKIVSPKEIRKSHLLNISTTKPGKPGNQIPRNYDSHRRNKFSNSSILTAMSRRANGFPANCLPDSQLCKHTRCHWPLNKLHMTHYSGRKVHVEAVNLMHRTSSGLDLSVWLVWSHRRSDGLTRSTGWGGQGVIEDGRGQSRRIREEE